MTAAPISTDVLVVGAGPCGMTIANLLGVYGVSTVVIDREADVIDYPRAVGIDDESLRTCQTFGLVDDVLADTLQDMPIKYFTSWGRCLAHVQPSARPFGWPRRNLFLQPLLERTLRKGVTRFASVDVRLGTELVGLERPADGRVRATVRDAAGERVVEASWVVGADGGRSTVRDALGVALEGHTEPVKWLVVDLAGDELDAPYAAVFCDSDSPTLMVPLPYRHRRFEFRLHDGVDEAAVVQPEHVRGLIAERYQGCAMPEVVRARVYIHHSRVAAAFQVGRVLLAGDAAHLQPPFFGQGMNSGLRDATNLAWKLAAVTRGVAGAELVTTYDAERRPHATEMVRFATRIGAMYRPLNIVTERVRDAVFRGIQLFPGGRDYILQMKYKPMPRYTEGAVAGVDRRDRDDPVGRMFPQPDVTVDGTRVRLDDAIGPWFALLCLDGEPDQLDPAAMAWLRSIGAAVFVVRPKGSTGEVGELVDVDGAIARWREDHPTAEVVILRPDRYVAAACRCSDLGARVKELRQRFGAAGPAG